MGIPGFGAGGAGGAGGGFISNLSPINLMTGATDRAAAAHPHAAHAAYAKAARLMPPAEQQQQDAQRGDRVKIPHLQRADKAGRPELPLPLPSPTKKPYCMSCPAVPCRAVLCGHHHAGGLLSAPQQYMQQRVSWFKTNMTGGTMSALFNISNHYGTCNQGELQEGSGHTAPAALQGCTT